MAISPVIKQAIFSLGALLNMMTVGMSIGYSAVLVPALLDPDSDIPADQYQTSWLVSITGISSLVPVLVVGPLMHLYGRRFTNFCVTVPTLLGWIIIGFSYSLPALFLGRFLHCLQYGMVFFYATCISEFSSPRIRGVLLNMKLFVVSSGITLIHVLGSFLHWRHLALVGTVPSIISLTITFYWPETPDWLVTRGRYKEAETVFFSLRGSSNESNGEIKKLIEETQIKLQFSKQYTIIDFFKKLKSRALWRPVVLVYFGILLPELGGRVYFPAYSIQLTRQISGDDTKGFIYTYILDAVQLISTVFSFYFIKNYNRRLILLYPCYFCVVVLMTVSALIFIKAKYYETQALMWIILLLLSLYMLVLTCTTFAVSYVIIGELLPLEYRAAGVVINGVLSCVTDMAAMRIMPLMRDKLQLYGMFLVYCCGMLLTLAYLQYNLPETKDRTLQDISDYFSGKSPKVQSKRTAVFHTDENQVLNP